MKKLAVLLVVVAFIVTQMVGCGQGGSTAGGTGTGGQEQQSAGKDASTPSNAGGQPVTLNFMTVGDPYVGAIKILLPEFESKYNIKVNIDSIPYLNLHEKAVMELAGKSGSYDLISMDAPWAGEFFTAGYAMELTDLVNRDKAEIQPDDFLPGAWKGLALWDDKIMALPLAPYYMYLHYRTDKFQEKGLNPPQTYDEFVDVIQKLYDEKNSFYGLSVAMKRGASIVDDWCAYYNGFGGKTFVDVPNNYRTDINGDIGIMTTNLFKTSLKYSPPGVLQFENIDRWNSFMHGNSGMVAVFNANSPMFETAEDTKVAGKVGYAALPKKSADAKPSLPFGGFSIIINAASKNADASWQFMKWLSSPEIDKKWVQIPGTPGVPLRMSTLSDPELLQKYPYFGIILDAEKNGYADGVNYRARIPEWVQMQDIMGLELNLAVSGEKDVKKALDDAAGKINELLKEKGYPVN
jgi:multiple sugar transport system substrate-binding protein